DSHLLDLLTGLLHLDPDERLTPHQALMHPFFGKVFPFSATLGVSLTARMGWGRAAPTAATPAAAAAA
ncbi:unnamed protein product, partial [Discosporangium mesarthrocarpum]